MSTVSTTINDAAWHAVASGAGEYLIEVTTSYYWAYADTASPPAADFEGYNGSSGMMPPVTLTAGKSLFIRQRGALVPFRVVVTTGAL